MGVPPTDAFSQIDPEEIRVREGEYVASETPLETAWTFWYDKKTSDRKESDQYMEGLRQLGSFNTIEGFYRHYAYLLKPNEFPRDHNVLLFRKGYKPMWEEFPEGGCWIIRIKRKVSHSYVNRMWENLIIACVGEAFEMPDVVGCVLSTRLKDDVLSVWNLSNKDTQARFRIGEKLKEVFDLDTNALIQYKDHMQSLQDYSTYRNAKNYMFAPSPTSTPMPGILDTPDASEWRMNMEDVDQGMGEFDTMLPPAAVDTVDEVPDRARSRSMSGNAPVFSPQGGSPIKSPVTSPQLSANAAPWSPTMGITKSPPLSAEAPPWQPGDAPPASVSQQSSPVAEPQPAAAPAAASAASEKPAGASSSWASVVSGKSTPQAKAASTSSPEGSSAAATKDPTPSEASKSPTPSEASKSPPVRAAGGSPKAKSWAEMAAGKAKPN
eukprot:gnl/TRDRNA2_/TRDRNA2_64477_c0_seq1.p1 gnl/TRDRNA2_/TRDRNA2_64477_c0~~gnl/TRDRNA2_/TRDRNA2_64477_c0_seq1.p1  ORF type:complete len:464 (+),score=81.28 gnl/TRDRNA2_/TRDRNA2_64477_c0_seq1:82-1392(+)